MKKWFSVLLLWLPATVFSWNALGHRLVAQIAYDQMTPHAKNTFNKFNHALEAVYKPQSFINSAVWLDTLRYQDVNWFAAMHYIDLPFSNDGSLLPPSQEVNAVWAIDKSTRLLLNQYATDFDKGMGFRILLHVVGDLHQPLHAATRITETLPKGDRGGNLVALQDNAVAKNLHAYWDRGAGLLVNKHTSPTQIRKWARQMEQHWPCKLVPVSTLSIQWAKESHVLAVKKVYQLPINKHYQKMAQELSEKQLALAGCRLGGLLNAIDTKLMRS